MEIQEFLDKQTSFYESVMEFVSNEEQLEDQILFDKIISSDYQFNKKDEFELALKIISKISNNHYRSPTFNKKIEAILQHYFDQIKQTFKNSEIFEIFQDNKFILLFLFNKKILKADKTILPLTKAKSQDDGSNIDDSDDYSDSDEYDDSNEPEDDDKMKENYFLYFYPEIMRLIPSQQQKSIATELLQIGIHDVKNLISKRKTGENDNYICELIRKDSIKDFISHVNRSNIPLSTTKIKPSIFESNPFLFKNRPTLIEYAAFFGSIQIFQYLRLNQVEMRPSLWKYATHGKNAEIIHLLEEDKLNPPKSSFKTCLKLALKFHHNEIANYIIDNLNDDEDIDNYLRDYSLRYYNFTYFHDKFEKDILISYLCKYFPNDFVAHLMKELGMDLDMRYAKRRAFFKDCSKLKKLTILPGLTVIESNAFSNCINLQEINLPSTVTSIGTSAFYNCQSLQEITLPQNVRRIRKYGFQRCSSLKQVTIPPSLDELGLCIFTECTSLKSVTIHSKLRRIGDEMFSYCSSLTEITIPSTVETICEKAFYKCTSLKVVNFACPSSLKFILLDSFNGCSSLIEINIPSSVMLVGTNAFEGCSSLTMVSLPCVGTIGVSAFNGCSSLEKATFGTSSVDVIREHIFCNCSSLKEIEIPSTVKTIKENAFDGCLSLKKVLIRSSETSIDESLLNKFNFLPNASIQQIYDKNLKEIPSLASNSQITDLQQQPIQVSKSCLII